MTVIADEISTVMYLPKNIVPVQYRVKRFHDWSSCLLFLSLICCNRFFIHFKDYFHTLSFKF